MRIAVLAAAIFALLAPSVASAKEATPWATVNLCNTAKRPDAIGIRASMPGVPKGARLAMRFRVQFKPGKGWQDVKGANSGWQPVGTARGVDVESGWSFTFAHPSSTYTLRGMVQLRWRRGGTVLRFVEIPTESGHRSSAGADPPDYSAATCTFGS